MTHRTESPAPAPAPARAPARTRDPVTAPAAAGEWLFATLQRALPQHRLSRVVHRLTRLRAGPLTRAAIHTFVRAFDVDLRDAAEPGPGQYDSFNTFFTRALRPDARPLDARANALLCPVDGAVSRLGRLDEGRLVQAKGHAYDVAALLGGDTELAARFKDGAFATLYLSPRDYHRVHMPIDGTLTQTIHVPGRLFSVNAATTAQIARLYARNERVICLFDTAIRGGAGGRHLRRQHRDDLARRADTAARASRATTAAANAGTDAGTRRRAWTLQHGLHRDPAATSGRCPLAAGPRHGQPDTRRRGAGLARGERLTRSSSTAAIRLAHAARPKAPRM